MAINGEQALVNVTGMEIILRPISDQERQVISYELEENKSQIIASAAPLRSLTPKQAEELKHKKRRRTTPTEFDEEIQKDFSLLEIFKIEDIEEINRRKEENGEAMLDPEKVLKNINGWTIEKRNRGGNIRKDQFYRHEITSKRKLRSLVEVKRCIEENSYLGNDSDSHEESKVDLINGNTILLKYTDEGESSRRVPELVENNIKFRKPVKCSKCHNEGHNLRTCRG